MIPTNAIRTYQSGFVWVTNATDSTRVFPFPCPEDLMRRGGCWIMDPLLPLNHNKSTKGKLIENMTCGLWFDVSVPRDALPGNYTSNFTLVVGEEIIQDVVVKLRVYNFELPTSPRLKNAIQIDIAHIYRSFPSLEMNELRKVFLETCDYLLENFRVNPGSIYNSWSNFTAENMRRYVSPFVANSSDLVRWKRLGMNTITIPFTPMNKTRDFVNEILEVDPTLISMLNFYGFDEFSGNFTEISTAFLPLRKEFPEIQTMTTAHVGTQYPGIVKDSVPFDSAGLNSMGVTQIVPQTDYLPSRQNLSEVQDHGLEAWTYISLQPYKPYACFRLDNALIDVRGLFWQIFHYNFDGFLYWGLNQWSLGDFAPISSQDANYPFIDPKNWNLGTYDDGTLPWLFGDGKMLYVGEDGPIASIRLANIRDGLDDYDYFSLLQDLNPSYASSLVTKISGNTITDLIRNITMLQDVRAEVGNALDKNIGTSIY